jgi:hypothetical protein
MALEAKQLLCIASGCIIGGMTGNLAVALPYTLIRFAIMNQNERDKWIESLNNSPTTEQKILSLVSQVGFAAGVVAGGFAGNAYATKK